MFPACTLTELQRSTDPLRRVNADPRNNFECFVLHCGMYTSPSPNECLSCSFFSRCRARFYTVHTHPAGRSLPDSSPPAGAKSIYSFGSKLPSHLSALVVAAIQSYGGDPNPAVLSSTTIVECSLECRKDQLHLSSRSKSQRPPWNINRSPPQCFYSPLAERHPSTQHSSGTASNKHDNTPQVFCLR